MAVLKDDVRVDITMPKEFHNDLKKIAANKGVSMRQILLEAIKLKIQYENECYYPLNTLAKIRLDQMYGTLIALDSTIQNLTNITEQGFDSFLAVTRGDNFLIENAQADIERKDE